jgi:hypothetical protein
VNARDLLFQHISEQVEIRRAFVAKMGAAVVILAAINRTRAVVQKLDAPIEIVRTGPLGLREERRPEQWTVPMSWLLPPGCLESDPRQLPLFPEAGK